MALVPLLEVSSPLTVRRGVCLPFTDFCDPLLFRGCDSSLASKLLCEFACSRKWNHLAQGFYNDRKNCLKGSTEMADARRLRGPFAT